MINRKRGLIRLAIVAFAAWCLTWGWIAYSANATIDYQLKEMNRIEAERKAAGISMKATFIEIADRMEDVNRASVRVAAAVQWGIGLPLVLLLISPVAWWIYRGFKPKSDKPLA